MPVSARGQLLLVSMLVLSILGTARADEDEDLRAGDDLFNKADYAGALKRWRTAAERGNAEALFKIAELYWFGRGVKRDIPEAYRWYRKSADRGYAQAMTNIGFAYWEGRYFEQDFAEAMRWYRKAADTGLAQAMTNIGVLYEKGQGVEQDYAEALRWHRKAAKKGHPHAQYNVAMFYERGWGIDRNYVEALAWYRKSAQLGFTYSMTNLGCMYLDGRGANRDLSIALQWFRQSHSKAPNDFTAARIWLCLAVTGNPEPARAFVKAYRSYPGPGRHAGGVVRFLNGEMTEAELVKHVASGPRADQRTCAAYFFAGSARLAAGDRKGAISRLEKCIDAGATDCSEYRSAKAELARLRAER